MRSYKSYLDEYINEAQNISTHPKRLNTIFQTIWKKRKNKSAQEILTALALNPNSDANLLKLLFQTGFADKVMQNPIIPLLKLANPLIIQEWIKNAEYPEKMLSAPFDLEVQYMILKTDDIKLLDNLAASQFSSEEILNVLANNRNSYIRCSVGINSNTPPSTLAKLLKDKSGYVRSSTWKDNVKINKNSCYKLADYFHNEQPANTSWAYNILPSVEKIIEEYPSQKTSNNDDHNCTIVNQGEILFEEYLIIVDYLNDFLIICREKTLKQKEYYPFVVFELKSKKLIFSLPSRKDKENWWKIIVVITILFG